MADIPQKLLMPNTTQIPNVLLDVIMPAVSPATWKIISCVARQTYGWQKRWDAISISTVEKKTGLSNRFVIDTMEEMRDAGLLLRREGERKEFGYEYSLNIECDMERAAELLKQNERKARIRPSGGRKKSEAAGEQGSPLPMNPVHGGHEPSADAASSRPLMNSVPGPMNPVHTQKPTTSKTNYPNQRGASPSVLIIATRQMWQEFERRAPQVGVCVPNRNQEAFERLLAAANEAGLSRAQLKQVLREHPHWKDWRYTELIDSQQEIEFPTPPEETEEEIRQKIERSMPALSRETA
jgi:hypothetical protein